MSRFEIIKNGTDEEKTQVLCDIVELIYNKIEEECYLDGNPCDYCPATNFCKLGHTGFLDW